MAHKLLLLDHAEALGGAEHSLLLLMKHLDHARWSSTLACSGGPLAERARGLGVAAFTLPMPRLRRSPRALLDWLTGARAVAALARQIDAELVYANTVRSAVYGTLAARLVGLPLIWHMRDFWLGESQPRYAWVDALGKRLLGAASARVIANSHAVAANLPFRRKVTVVHNGVEIGRFDPAMDGQPFRQQQGIPSEAPLVGTVGRLRPWKGQERFLRANARVLAQIPEAWFVIIGGAIFEIADGYAEQLQKLSTDLGLAGRVVFTGHMEDVRPALAALDVFVHPGDPEPFGLVNIEAMAMGKPVVAFDHGALPEIVADPETGVLIAPGNEAALAKAVIALLQDPALRQSMGNAGRVRVETRFTAEHMATQVEAVLGEVLA
jgi:glycosyltransferase involved in cell wall biosynthesis